MALVVLAGTEVPAYLGPTAWLVLAAAIVGYLAVRIRVVPIVGFLLAGVAIGPAQLGLVDSSEAVNAAADVGVNLLLFTIGIEFSFGRLVRVWRWIVVSGGLQVTAATAAGLGLTLLLGGGWREGVFAGFLIALSSTAIVLKLLADSSQTSSTKGRLALATLIFQDLAVVAMVLVVPLLAADHEGGSGALFQALGTAALVIAGVLLVARRIMPPVLERVAALCVPEVFLLSVVALCFGTAFLTASAGVSVSLGAFLAGVLVSESRHSTHAFAEVLPLQIIFSAVFFVSVGMLLDVGFLLSNLTLVLGVAALVLVVKVLTTTLAMLPLRIGWRTALGTALLLGQIGEFSFVLLNVGQDAGLSPAGLGEKGAQTFVATTVLLMVLTPVMAALGDRFRGGAQTTPTGDQSRPVDTLDHVVFLGWGPDTISIASDLRQRGVSVAMTTLNPGGAAAAEAAGIQVVRGDSRHTQILEHARIGDAKIVVLAEDANPDIAQQAELVRRHSAAPIVARTEGGASVQDLGTAGVNQIIDPARVTREMLLDGLVERLGLDPPQAGDETRTWANTTQVVRTSVANDTTCRHVAMLNLVSPTARGCVPCIQEGQRWVHLRLCLTCGFVGCCDSSPGRHARAHAGDEAHPIMASLEGDSDWAFCFVDDLTMPAERS